MVKSPQLIFNSSLRKDYNDVEQTRMLLTSVLREHKIDYNFIPNIELSVYETLVNIIEHTSIMFMDHPIIIECYITDTSVRISISNYGEKFDLTGIEMPDIEEHFRFGKMRGLGIYFIRTLMDTVEYSYENMINYITLIKELKT